MTTNFSLKHIKTLEFEDQKAYLIDYIIPFTNNTYAIRIENTLITRTIHEGGVTRTFEVLNNYEIIDYQTLMTVYFKRLSPELNKFFFEEYDEIQRPFLPEDKTEIHKLDNIAEFIVQKYIMTESDMHIKPNDLFIEYTNWFIGQDKDIEYTTGEQYAKKEFVNALSDYGFVTKKSGTTFYKYLYNELYEIAYKNNWVILNIANYENYKLKKENENLKGFNKKLNDELNEVYDEVERLKEKAIHQVETKEVETQTEEVESLRVEEDEEDEVDEEDEMDEVDEVDEEDDEEEDFEIEIEGEDTFL